MDRGWKRSERRVGARVWRKKESGDGEDDEGTRWERIGWEMPV